MSASLAVQVAIRNRFVATPALIALVPAENIIDRNARPNPDPSIILGEDQEVDENRIRRNVVRIYSTLHVWKKEDSLEGVKAIGAAIKAALRAGVASSPAYRISACYVASARYLRDPDGETSHGVVTIESMVYEVLP
jgi:hypothetical protein